jgi:hypothetical protein
MNGVIIKELFLERGLEPHPHFANVTQTIGDDNTQDAQNNINE